MKLSVESLLQGCCSSRILHACSSSPLSEELRRWEAPAGLLPQARRCVATGAQGVANLVTAAQRQGHVQRVVLVSSIGADDPFFPLNALWGVCAPSSPAYANNLPTFQPTLVLTQVRPEVLRVCQPDC